MPPHSRAPGIPLNVPQTAQATAAAAIPGRHSCCGTPRVPTSHRYWGRERQAETAVNAQTGVQISRSCRDRETRFSPAPAAMRHVTEERVFRRAAGIPASDAMKTAAITYVERLRRSPAETSRVADRRADRLRDPSPGQPTRQSRLEAPEPRQQNDGGSAPGSPRHSAHLPHGTCPAHATMGGTLADGR